MDVARLCLADASIYHQVAEYTSAYPWTPKDVAPATPGVPLPGYDPRAKHNGADCEACRLWRFRTHFAHNRIVGTCVFPTMSLSYLAVLHVGR